VGFDVICNELAAAMFHVKHCRSQMYVSNSYASIESSGALWYIGADADELIIGCSSKS